MKTFFQKVWAVIYKQVVVNWKSTLAGILFTVVGWLYFDGVISADVVGMIILVFGMFGVVINDPRPKVK